MWRLVEGSITTAEDVERIQAVRKDSKFLVTIGACATAGGIQALRNWQDVGEFTRAVYATPAYIHTLEQSTPISSHVAVDFEVNGCPINKKQILEVITALAGGAHASFAQAFSMHGVQETRHGVCHGGAGCALPGPADPDRLRRHLPCLQSRLLRLFWPPAGRECGFIERPIAERRHAAGRLGALASRVHRVCGGVPVGERQMGKGGLALV